MDKRVAKRRDKKDGRCNSMDGDRLSELPQPILHHILSFLSQKVAVQTCLLSKTWRYLGPTRPKIDFREVCSECSFNNDKFCENCFGKNKKTFIFVLDTTFQRYHDQNIPIHEFHFDLPDVDSKSTLLLEEWIPKLITPNMVVKTFELQFVSFYCITGYFDLPLVILQLKSLQKLDLHRCRLSRIDSICLKHLRMLNFDFVCIEEATLEKIMSSCPLIENVRLVWCKGVTTFKSVNKLRSLKDFYISFYVRTSVRHKNYHSIEIDAPNLENISIVECSNWYLHNKHLPNLKSLCLSSVRLPAMLFDDFASKFPCLEKLQISYCYGFEEIQLASHSIKSLIMNMGCDSQVKAAIIDAANIHYFKFSGYPLPSSFSFTTSSSEWTSHVHMSPKVYADEYSLSTWLLKLNEFLKAICRSKISLQISYGNSFMPPKEDALSTWLLTLAEFLKTFCRSQNSLGICNNDPSPDQHIEGGFYEPIVVEHLDLGSCDSSSTSLPDFLICLFCICRPRYINVGGERNSVYNKLTESVLEILGQESVKRDYFWRKDLEELTLEMLDENTTEWYPTTTPALCKSPQKIRFLLKWRD